MFKIIINDSKLKQLSPLCVSQLDPRKSPAQHPMKHTPLEKDTLLPDSEKVGSFFRDKAQRDLWLAMIQENPTIKTIISDAITKSAGDCRIQLDVNINDCFPLFDDLEQKKYHAYDEETRGYSLVKLNWITLVLDFPTELQEESNFQCTLQTIFPLDDKHKSVPEPDDLDNITPEYQIAANAISRIKLSGEIIYKVYTERFAYNEKMEKLNNFYQLKPQTGKATKVIYLDKKYLNEESYNIFLYSGCNRIMPRLHSSNAILRSSFTLKFDAVSFEPINLQKQGLLQTKEKVERAKKSALSSPKPIESNDQFKEKLERLIPDANLSDMIRFYNLNLFESLDMENLNATIAILLEQLELSKSFPNIINSVVSNAEKTYFTAVDNQSFHAFVGEVISKLKVSHQTFSLNLNGKAIQIISKNAKVAKEKVAEYTQLLNTNMPLLRSRLLRSQESADLQYEVTNMIKAKVNQCNEMKEKMTRLIKCEENYARIHLIFKESTHIAQRELNPAVSELDFMLEKITKSTRVDINDLSTQLKRYIQKNKPSFHMTGLLDLTFDAQKFEIRELISRKLIDFIELLIQYQASPDAMLDISDLLTGYHSFFTINEGKYTVSDELYAMPSLPYEDFCTDINTIRMLIKNTNNIFLNTVPQHDLFEAMKELSSALKTFYDMRMDYPNLYGIADNHIDNHNAKLILFSLADNLDKRLQFEKDYTNFLGTESTAMIGDENPHRNSRRLIDDFVSSVGLSYISLAETEKCLSRLIEISTPTPVMQSAARQPDAFFNSNKQPGKPSKIKLKPGSISKACNDETEGPVGKIEIQKSEQHLEEFRAGVC